MTILDAYHEPKRATNGCCGEHPGHIPRKLNTQASGKDNNFLKRLALGNLFILLIDKQFIRAYYLILKKACSYAIDLLNRT